MFFLLGRRIPYLGIIIGAALIIWGVAAHAVFLAILGAALAVVGVIRTVNRRRRD